MNMTDKDTISVRAGEELNVSFLEQYIREQIDDVPNEKLEVRQFGAGHSNLTYELKIGDWEAVLRRPPLGPVAPKAHDMEREHQILNAIHPVFPLAPKTYLFCEKSPVKAPFFLMERRHGIVLDSSFPSGVEVTEELCRRISETMVDTLVELHQIDYTQTPLVDMSKPDGFMERQVHGWIKRYERAKTDDVPGVEQLKDWMVKNIPSSQPPAIIHYDFKLNNAMFAEDDLTKIVGLFDWEMTTVGDPLADVGAAMSYWIQADDPDMLKRGLGEPPVTVQKGFMSRAEFLESYARKSGRDLSNIHFYLTFAYFKLAVICQQIYYRYKNGQTKDERFAHMNLFVQNLIQYAIKEAKL